MLNMMLIYVFCQLLLFLVYPILLGGFKHVDVVLDIFGVGINILDVERMENSSLMTFINYDYSLWRDMSGSFADSF